KHDGLVRLQEHERIADERVAPAPPLHTVAAQVDGVQAYRKLDLAAGEQRCLIDRADLLGGDDVADFPRIKPVEDVRALEPERDIVEPPREVPSRRLDALEDREDLDLGAQVDALRALRIEL